MKFFLSPGGCAPCFDRWCRQSVEKDSVLDAVGVSPNLYVGNTMGAQGFRTVVMEKAAPPPGDVVVAGPPPPGDVVVFPRS